MLIATYLLIFLTPALATLTPTQPRGERLVEHTVPGRSSEVCVIPKHFPEGSYKKGDIQQETQLCSMNAGESVAVCAKRNSSNPGLDFFVPPAGTSVGDFMAGNCSATGGRKEAKYKLSTSCSYTPSILAYYHLSRVLGEIGNVPVAVLRTFDLDRHMEIGEQGLKLMERGSLIEQTWKSLLSKLKAGRGGSQADLLLTDRFDQSYGALSKNPKNEAFYKEFYNGGTQRELTFKAKNLIYRALGNPGFQVKRQWNTANVQAMLQLKDMSEMILLDTILGQQDRFGNVHYYQKYYYLEKSGDGIQVRREKDLKNIPSEFQAGAVSVKELLLKDNDCGVAKENRVKAANLLDGVAHMDPNTYRNLLKLERNIDKPETKSFFQNELVFTEADFRKVAQNIREAVSLLKQKCMSRKLRLDLDLDAHFSGKEIAENQQCEI